jgi:hypothetical protein
MTVGTKVIVDVQTFRYGNMWVISLNLKRRGFIGYDAVTN